MRSYYWHERVLLSTAQSITITQVVSLFIYLFIYLSGGRCAHAHVADS